MVTIIKKGLGKKTIEKLLTKQISVKNFDSKKQKNKKE